MLTIPARRRGTSALCVLLITVNELALPGCAPVAPPAGSGDIELSASSLDPGQFLIISHASIVAGSTAKVRFEGPQGTLATVESYSVENGSVGVAVPAFVDYAAGTIGPGDVTVSVLGIDSQAALHINDLPPLDGVEPGAVFALFLRSAIEDYQKTIANLADIEAQSGQADSLFAIDQLNAEIARLQATLTELETNRQLVVDLGAAGVVTLTSDWLQTGDRLLVSMLIASADSDSAALKGSTARRGLLECYGLTAPGQPAPPPLPSSVSPGDCALDVVQGAIRGVRDTVAPALETGGRVVSAAGLVVAAVAATTAVVAGTPVVAAGAAASAGTLALTGLLLSVMGAGASFAGAAVQGKNTDQWLQETGEGFNAGLEALSQLVRVGVSAASTAFEPLENLASFLTTWGDRFLTGMDFYNGQKCSDEGGQQKQRPLQQCTGVCAFCAAVRPQGCDNSCALAFDGLCDDGGPDSFSDVCALGTDCLDCGPRGNGDNAGGGAEGVGCTNTCSSANDGFCDDGGTGSSFDTCFLGTDCADCGVRDVSVCSDTCGDAGDGICDDGGAGATFAICELGTDCTDCGPRSGDGQTDGNSGGTDGGSAFTILAFTNTDGFTPSGSSIDPSEAQIQLSGDPARPTFSWTGVSGVFSLMVTTMSDFFPQAVYGLQGETPPDETGATEQVAFAFSSVTYGTYGLTNTAPMLGPAGALGPADAVPLSPGPLVSVTIISLTGELATLTFQVN